MIFKATSWLTNFHGILGFCQIKCICLEESAEERATMASLRSPASRGPTPARPLPSPLPPWAQPWMPPRLRRLCFLCRCALSHLVSVQSCCETGLTLKPSPTLAHSTWPAWHTQLSTPHSRSRVSSSWRHHLPPSGEVTVHITGVQKSSGSGGNGSEEERN